MNVELGTEFGYSITYPEQHLVGKSKKSHCFKSERQLVQWYTRFINEHSECSGIRDLSTSVTLLTQMVRHTIVYRIVILPE